MKQFACQNRLSRLGIPFALGGDRSMLIGFASAARHEEGLTILNYSTLGGELLMLIGYALTARQKEGPTF